MGVTQGTRRARTREMGEAFLDEARRDLERATAQGTDVPPRIRIAHERVGHATAEYRTLAVPIPPGAEGASPEVLSRVIASYVADKEPTAIVLVLDVLAEQPGGETLPLLIAEARDAAGTRLFFSQSFRTRGPRVDWADVQESSWSDPGDDEMILDAAFQGR